LGQTIQQFDDQHSSHCNFVWQNENAKEGIVCNWHDRWQLLSRRQKIVLTPNGKYYKRIVFECNVCIVSYNNGFLHIFYKIIW